jgi:hypothetical protein
MGATATATATASGWGRGDGTGRQAGKWRGGVYGIGCAACNNAGGKEAGARCPMMLALLVSEVLFVILFIWRGFKRRSGQANSAAECSLDFAGGRAAIVVPISA